MLLLLDANISPKTAEFMRRRFSFDTTSLIESRKTHLADEEIITLAKRENRIIITQDLDFGELYHEADPSFGVIILRLDDQRSSNVNAVLENFFANNLGQKIFQSDPHTLAVDHTLSRHGSRPYNVSCLKSRIASTMLGTRLSSDGQ